MKRRISRRASVVSLCLLASLVFGLSAVGAEASPAGLLLSSGPSSTVDPSLAAAGARVTDIRYQSTPTLAGTIGEVTGAVYLPEGTPPDGGWPLIVYAHGTSGVETRCAPSQDSALYGNLPVVRELLDQGWAVVATDYRGLGSPGQHPYTHARSAAYDVLDSVRAARQAVPGLSHSAVLLGVSQGGQAAEAAAEIAPSYAPELSIAGLALASPALNLAPMADVIDQKSWSPSQPGVIAMMVRGLQGLRPATRLADYLHGQLLTWAQGPIPCTGEPLGIDISQIDRSSLGFANDVARAALRQYLSESQLPKKPANVPVFISRGDRDTLVVTAWQDSAVRKMCALGDRVDQNIRPGDHTDQGDLEPTIAWIQNVLAGRATPDVCAA